jgi:hypothetical protein
LNATEFAAAGAIFSGDSVSPFQQSQLWDIKDFDVTSRMTAGNNTLSLTTGAGGNECMSLLVAAVVVQPLTTTDLVVDTLTHYPANPTDQDLLTVTARVRNAGQGQAGPSTLELCVGNETPGPSGNCAHPAVPTLAPGGTFTYVREVTGLTANTHTNIARADYLNAAPETIETNNVATDAYSVIQAAGATLSGPSTTQRRRLASRLNWRTTYTQTHRSDGNNGWQRLLSIPLLGSGYEAYREPDQATLACPGL